MTLQHVRDKAYFSYAQHATVSVQSYINIFNFMAFLRNFYGVCVVLYDVMILIFLY